MLLNLVFEDVVYEVLIMLIDDVFVMSELMISIFGVFLNVFVGFDFDLTRGSMSFVFLLNVFL